MSPLALVILATSALLAAFFATALVLRLLQRWQVLDRPNDRSSHTVPTPRGGGLAVTPLVMLAVAGIEIAGGAAGWRIALLLSAAAVLAVLSWHDDRHGLSAGLRFAVQIAAVSAGVTMLSAPVFQGLLPAWADGLAAGFLWLWFINAVNFMDGIDGLSGAEAAAIGLGVFLVSLVVPDPGLIDLGAVGLALLGIALGFLLWNWSPARLFLGDVGSVPLGFLLGWLLLELAGRGYWAAALVLPAYYLADASLTLGLRLLRGEAFWRPHRQHCYQRAVDRGWGHGPVVGLISAANVGLVALILTAPLGGWQVLAAAGGLVAALLAILRWAPAPGLARRAGVKSGGDGPGRRG